MEGLATTIMISKDIMVEEEVTSNLMASSVGLISL